MLMQTGKVENDIESRETRQEMNGPEERSDSLRCIDLDALLNASNLPRLQ